MKKIFLNGEINKCTEKELKVLEKFFVVEEEEKVIVVERIPQVNDVYKLSSRKIFKDVKSIKQFIKALDTMDLSYIIGNNSTSGRLVAVHENYISSGEDLMEARIPTILFNSRFTSLYPESTRYDMVSIDRFNKMSDNEISKYQWIFDMGLTNRKRKTKDFEQLFEDMITVVNKQKLPFECKVKNTLLVVKTNKKK